MKVTPKQQLTNQFGSKEKHNLNRFMLMSAVVLGVQWMFLAFLLVIAVMALYMEILWLLYLTGLFYVYIYYFYRLYKHYWGMSYWKVFQYLFLSGVVIGLIAVIIALPFLGSLEGSY